jgi:hypothetical protein
MKQQSFLDQKPIHFQEESEFLALADKGLGDSLELGLDAASEYAQAFVSMEEGSGLGLAKFLHGVNYRWKDFEPEAGDSFQKWAVRSTSRAAATIQRRVCVWEWLTGDYIPAAYKDAIHGFSMKMLSKAYKVSLRHRNNKFTGKFDFEPSGFDLGASEWLLLTESADEAMLTEALDKIMGREPNSNRTAFKLDDNGDIWYYRGKKDSAVIGSLSIKNPSPLVKDGIAELMERAGITERNDY